MALSGEKDLLLDSLQSGLLGISPTAGSFVAEACAICLTSQGHASGVELKVSGLTSDTFRVWWNLEVTDQIRRSWGDEATEHGACAVAFLLIPKMTGYTIIRRARTGTGVDYWLGYRESVNILQDAARLEISGILRATNMNAVQSRSNMKKRQTEQSDGALPAYVVVVEFGMPQAQVVLK
ncbi:MAG: hypothetical protein WCD37_09335 [Chloroflexia bacterium]